MHVSQLTQPLSQPCLCASEPPSSWAWSRQSGWGTLVLLGLGACWGRHQVDISVGGCSPPRHLPTAQVRGSPVTPSPPSAQGCRDPEGFLCNVLFLKRGKKQTAGGLYGVRGAARGRGCLPLTGNAVKTTDSNRALPEFRPLVSRESCRSHQSQESEQTPGDGEGQGSLACCSPWGCRESDMTKCLNTTTTRITGGCGEGTAHRSPERGACHVTRVPKMRAGSSSWCRISNNLLFAV